MRQTSNLIVVNLIVDHVLKANGPWTWNYSGMVTASGSYNIDTSNMAPGTHTVEIQAYVEHGANNAGPNNPPNWGGLPSSNIHKFQHRNNLHNYTHPTNSPTHSPIVSPSPTVSQNSSPTSSTTPIQTPSSTVPQTEPSQKQNSPSPSTNSTLTTYVTFLIIALVILLFALSLILKKKRKNEKS